MAPLPRDRPWIPSSPNPAGGTTGSDPGSDPDPTPGLPSCTYGDTMTTYRSAATDDRSLVDTEWRLPSTYAPDDLVAVSRAGLTGGGRIRRLVVDDLTAMARSARAAGARLAVQSAYRSYATQVATFNRWVSQDGYARARLASARPGHSEHQLGTTIDFKSYRGTTPWSHGDWGTTKAGTWLRTHAWEYGFVMSYPKGKRSLDLLQVRTVALPLRRPGCGGGDQRLGADPPRVAVEVWRELGLGLIRTRLTKRVERLELDHRQPGPG